ncbi:MAG: hypothetical protein ABR909_07070 [Candidatus Bathyarchaeia archaeon]
MRKSIKAAIAIFLISAFAFSLLSLSIPTVKADYDNNYLPAAYFYSTNWLNSYAEQQAIGNATSFIDNLFQQQYIVIINGYGMPVGAIHTYGIVENYGDSTSTALINTNLHDDINLVKSGDDYFPFATTLYIGHGSYYQGVTSIFGYDTHPPNQLFNYSDPPTQAYITSSTDISGIGSQYEKFVFLWSCYSGINDTNSGYMPYAWSDDKIKTLDISITNGQWTPDSSGYCFIGFGQNFINTPWEGDSSPWLTDPLKGGYTCQGWLEGLYYYALYPDTTINEALDMTSYVTNGGQGTFSTSPFWVGTSSNNPHDIGGEVTYWNTLTLGNITVSQGYWVGGQWIDGGPKYSYPNGTVGAQNVMTNVPFPVYMMPWGDGNLMLPTIYYVLEE